MMRGVVLCEGEVFPDEAAEGGAPGDVFVESAGVDEEGDGGGGEGLGGAAGVEEGLGSDRGGGEGGDAVALIFGISGLLRRGVS